MLIRLLKKNDNRKNFSSGEELLDLFFHRFAGQNQFRHSIGATYVAEENSEILGFMTIAPGSLEAESLPSSKVPLNYPLPILRLGRLAVDQKHQGKGIGKVLLLKCLELALYQKEHFGCVGILVDAKEDAVSFYEQYGFFSLEQLQKGEIRTFPPLTPMFLNIKTVQKLLPKKN